MTTKKGPNGCEFFFNTKRDEWNADPNNVIYKFITNITKNDVIDPAEWKIFKRRQRTKDGKESPQNPCDDKGKPLFLTSSGEITTKAEGNEIAWGSWIDAIRGDVSTETLTKAQRCHGHRIKLRGSYHYSLSEKEIEDAIAHDKAFHDKQQASRASKVAVDYKHELAKAGSSHPEWTCKITKEKAREYPTSWVSATYNPLKVDASPLLISFSYDKHERNEKTGKYKTIHTGVGNFKGRIAITEKIKNGQVFGMRPLEDNMEKAGFKKLEEGTSYPKYALQIPGRDDVCFIETTREDFPYAANYLTNRYLESPEGKVYLGGMFRSARFKIARTEPGTKHVFEHRVHEYQEKAPKKSVEFCHEKFNEIIKHAIIKLEEPSSK